MSSVNPNIKQNIQHVKIIKVIFVNLLKNIKYKFIKINDEKIIIPPNKGSGFLSNFLILSGLSISLIFLLICLLYLLIEKIINNESIVKLNSTILVYFNLALETLSIIQIYNE